MSKLFLYINPSLNLDTVLQNDNLFIFCFQLLARLINLEKTPANRVEKIRKLANCCKIQESYQAAVFASLFSPEEQSASIEQLTSTLNINERELNKFKIICIYAAIRMLIHYEINKVESKKQSKPDSNNVIVPSVTAISIAISNLSNSLIPPAHLQGLSSIGLCNKVRFVNPALDTIFERFSNEILQFAPLLLKQKNIPDLEINPDLTTNFKSVEFQQTCVQLLLLLVESMPKGIKYLHIIIDFLLLKESAFNKSKFIEFLKSDCCNSSVNIEKLKNFFTFDGVFNETCWLYFIASCYYIGIRLLSVAAINQARLNADQNNSENKVLPLNYDTSTFGYSKADVISLVVSLVESYDFEGLDKIGFKTLLTNLCLTNSALGKDTFLKNILPRLFPPESAKLQQSFRFFLTGIPEFLEYSKGISD